jgi:tetratricopeptide (TPR) repeat protein
MRCSSHPWKAAVGYCSVCGSFGCDDCLLEHEGKKLCRKDYAPIQEQLDRHKRHEENKQRQDRQRLTVHTRDGKHAHGFCFALKLNDPGFHLDLVDKEGDSLGKSHYFAYQDVKKICYVKSWSETAERETNYRPWKIGGSEVVVVFEDGEVLRGGTYHPYRSADPRFYVIPDDIDGNDISVLVERAAVAGVYSPDEYKERLHKDLEQYLHERQGDERGTYELSGDFYFKRHEYGKALHYYKRAYQDHPDKSHIKKKFIVSTYNMGVHYFKRQELSDALKCMELVVKAMPDHPKAQKQMERIHRMIDQQRDTGVPTNQS